jgi:hypothetical protein
MGIPEYEAKRYEGAVKDGGSLLSVHCDTSEQIHTAKEALKDTGARDISSAGEAASNDKSGARGTYGNISDGDAVLEPVSDRVRGDGVVVDRDVEDREVIAGTSPTKKY